MAQPIEGRKGYTYFDYLTWHDGKRWEIIDGIAYEKIEGPSVMSDMTPAPGRHHQLISGRLFAAIFNFLKGKNAQVYSAPFDVIFKNEDNPLEKNVVVQPDLSVFCTDEYLDEYGASGAPDWIIEILSPYTSNLDLNTKFLLYQRYSVKEYWVLDPVKKLTTVFILKDGKYGEGKIFFETQNIYPFVFPDLKIELREIFTK